MNSSNEQGGVSTRAEEVPHTMFGILIDFKDVSPSAERLHFQLYRDIGIVGCANIKKKSHSRSWKTQLWASSYRGAGSLIQDNVRERP